MSVVFHIIRISIFLLLASCASSAWSVTVGSELGGKSPVGAWGFPGCYQESGEYDDQYIEEYLIFSSNTVESRVVGFGSDSTCGSVGSTLESESFAFNVIENFDSPGWGEDGLELPPECQDTSKCTDGRLDPSPNVTKVEYVFSPQESEFDTLYIDDTGLVWYLYRDAGDDDAWSKYMSGDEPLFKTDLAIGVIPVPAGIWLFGTALVGFVGYSRRRKIA